MTYRIEQKFYFHNGTYGAPDDGPLRAPRSASVLTFDTVSEAEDFLGDFLGDFDQYGALYTKSGTYVLSDGEHDRPHYYIIRNLHHNTVRYSDLSEGEREECLRP